MFEAEIMITGYTIIVSTVTLGIAKQLYKRRLKKLNQEIEHLRLEVSALKKTQY